MIRFNKGDATDAVALRFLAGLPPEVEVIITHITNNVGAWGAGFTGAIDDRFGYSPEDSYRYSSSALGDVVWAPESQVVQAILARDYPHKRPDLRGHWSLQRHPHLSIAHMCAQNGVGVGRGLDRVAYDMLRDTLHEVFKVAVGARAHVLMPWIGSGLAGGNWERIKSIIEDVHTASGMCEAKLDVHILSL